MKKKQEFCIKSILDTKY